MTDNEPQSVEEIEAQVGRGTAVDYVRAWFLGIAVDEDWRVGMAHMTEGLRLRHAEAWVEGACETGQVMESDRQETIAALAQADISHPSWADFAEANLAHYGVAIGSVYGNLAVGSLPRPVGVDKEIYHFVLYDDVDAEQIESDGLQRKYVDQPLPPVLSVVVQHTAGSAPRMDDIEITAAHPKFRELTRGDD